MPNADQLIEIFHEAIARPAGAARERFLTEACGNQAELREQVVSLLQSHSDAGDFLKKTIISPTVLITEKAGDMIGRYKLLEKVGEGGCGVVYVAEQTEPVRRRVALKVIKLGMDTKQVMARFEAERQALAMMDHPNIAKVLDAASTESGRPYFVMELVRGIRITEYCDQHKLNTRQRLDLFIKVCQAIQHAHQKGIIHRDIKPSNILVTLHDGVPVPKVIDFGIAKATEGRLTDNTIYTQLHQFIGTPAYMSPEQAEMSGLDIDTRSDIYSLGVLLYELLVGTTPFDGQELMASGLDAMRKTIREKEPTRPSTKLSQTLVAADVRRLKSSSSDTTGSDEEVRASRRLLQSKELIHQLKGDLDWIVMKCLEKDRTRRYDTANGLFMDIQRHLTNEPVMARPPSQLYRFQKAFRRNKVSFTAAAAVAAALVLGIGVSTWQAFEAGRQRLAAQNERDKFQEAQLKAEKSEQAEKEARLEAEAEKINAQHDRYVANINLVGQAWEQENFGRMQQVLEQTRNFPDRGFEWYYWQRQTHLNLLTLRGHLGLVRALSYSPDGQRLVTGSFDRTARVWEAASGRELTKLIGHSGEVNGAGFSPDGLRIVTAGSDHIAIVWQSTTGRKLFDLQGHSQPLSSAAFSPNGLWIATSSYDGTAQVWDARSYQKLHTLAGHTNGLTRAAFSPDSKLIVTGSIDRTARVWDTASGRLLHVLGGHETDVWSAIFSPDGQQIVTGGIGKIAKVWDAASGLELFPLEGRGTATSMSFSPDGRRLAVGSWDSAVRVWDMTTRSVDQTLRAEVKGVLNVAFSPDGRRITTAGGGDVKVWDSRTDLSPLMLQGNLSNVLCAAFSMDGKRIVTSTGLFGGDGKISGSGVEAAQVWDAASGEKLFTLSGHSSGISSVAFFPDGQRIVTGSGDHTARIWDARTTRELFILRGHTDSIGSVAISPDGRRIATGSHDGTARVWNADTGRELFTLPEHTGPITSVAFSGDGKLIITGGHDATVMLWEAATGRLVRQIVTKIERIYGVAFSPDSQRFAACGWGLAQLWELGADQEPLEFLGFGGPMSSLAFSPDGKRMVIGSLDGTARVWESTTGRELLALTGHRNRVHSVAFSPDGKRIVTGSHDRTALVWEAATEDQVAAWDEEERAAVESRPAWERELAALLRERAAEAPK